MTRSAKDQMIDESLRLVAIFMKLSDKKARAEILKLAERCAWFDARPALCSFSAPNENDVSVRDVDPSSFVSDAVSLLETPGEIVECSPILGEAYGSCPGRTRHDAAAITTPRQIGII